MASETPCKAAVETSRVIWNNLVTLDHESTCKAIHQHMHCEKVIAALRFVRVVLKEHNERSGCALCDEALTLLTGRDD